MTVIICAHPDSASAAWAVQQAAAPPDLTCSLVPRRAIAVKTTQTFTPLQRLTSPAVQV